MSCTNRRAVETGLRVAALLPPVAHRQWTLSLPFSLRFLVVKRGLALPPTPRRRRVAVAHGFSLHADTAVHGNDRQGLERLARS